MNSTLTRNFKTYFIESRFVNLVISVSFVILRFLFFMRKGNYDYPSFNTGDAWSYFESFFLTYPLISHLASTFFIFLLAFLSSELNNRYGIIRMRSAMPFYLPLILFSVHPLFLQMTPDLVAIVFIMWSMFPLLATYQFHHSHRNAFQFSALIALAAIFRIHALLLLPIWLIGLSALGEFNFRSLLASVLGVITIFWIVFAFYVFGDNITGFIQPFVRLGSIYDFRWAPEFSIPQWGLIGSGFLFILFFIVADSRQISRERSFTKKVLIFTISIILSATLLQVLYLMQTLFWIYVIIAFLSLVMSHYYTNATVKLEVYSFFTVIALLIFYLSINLFTNLSPF